MHQPGAAAAPGTPSSSALVERRCTQLQQHPALHMHINRPWNARNWLQVIPAELHSSAGSLIYSRGLVAVQQVGKAMIHTHAVQRCPSAAAAGTSTHSLARSLARSLTIWPHQRAAGHGAGSHRPWLPGRGRAGTAAGGRAGMHGAGLAGETGGHSSRQTADRETNLCHLCTDSTRLSTKQQTKPLLAVQQLSRTAVRQPTSANQAVHGSTNPLLPGPPPTHPPHLVLSLLAVVHARHLGRAVQVAHKRKGIHVALARLDLRGG